jgi:CDGSH-type Zn-finger protein
MNEAVIVQKKPYHVDVTEGETYAYCTCGLSDKQPFCNGAHKETSFTPHKFTAEATETLHLCGCKRTGNDPRCDGSHKSLED